MPRGGARGHNLGHLQNVHLTVMIVYILTNARIPAGGIRASQGTFSSFEQQQCVGFFC